MREIEEIPFGEKSIGKRRPFIIAEIGVNHEGDFSVCEQMVREAAKAGADAIKLQTIDADENYVKGTESYNIFKSCALTRDETARIFELTRKLKMEPFTTAGDFKTLDWVDDLQPAAHKISSGLLTAIPIVKHVCSKGKPVLISTGLASLEEIDETVDVINSYGNIPFGMFQCTSKYPTPDHEVNLAAISRLKERYRVPVGLSDHSIGIEASVLSIAAGSCMLERHFTLDKSRAGFDHKVSLLPNELTDLVNRTKKAYEFMGSASKEIPESVIEMRSKMNRCLVAKCEIKKGDFFSKENISIKRPFPDQRGLNPNMFDEVIGKKANRTLVKDDSIYLDDLEQ